MKLAFPSIRKINKTWAVLGVALAIGIVAALVTRSYLTQKIEAIESRGNHETVELLVAKTFIAKGSTVAVEDLAIRKIPIEFAQSGAVKPQDVLSIAGKVSGFDVKKGELVMVNQMLSQRAPTFSARLADGQRAITVMVDEINSISGMLEPGDLIDLMFTVDQNGRKIIFPLLQRVQVMATGKRSIDDPKGGEPVQFATVTLNTTPDQAKNIIIARETGKLTALLRSPSDKESGSAKSVDLATLFGAKREGPHVGQYGGVPVLYGGSAGKFPPEALQLGRYRGTATPMNSPPPPPVIASPPAAPIAVATTAGSP